MRMKNEIEKKSAPGRDQVEVLGSTYEEGKPNGETQGRWRQKLGSRSEKLKYLETGDRYFYGTEGFGSEKRKKPA
jgi:hypothetical protein